MLTPRMRSVAAFVPSGARVADIGCDHAYVSIALCEQGICDFVIAMDVRQGPIAIARANVHKAGLDEQITVRLSDGLEGLSYGEVDTIVIAGMGGLLIRDILKAGERVVRGLHTMVLQPQSEIEQVRRYVRMHGFEIVDETMIWDRDKPYFAMKCECIGDSSLPAWPEVEYIYGGPLLRRRDEGLWDFLIREQAHLERLTDALGRQKEECEGDKLHSRLEELKTLLEYNRQAQAYYS